MKIVVLSRRAWFSLPRSVWLLVAARGLNRLGAFTLPFLTVRLVEAGASMRAAGLLFALFGIGTIPSRLLGGILADRIGRRPTIVLGLIGTAAAQLAVAGVSGVAGLAAAVVVLGLAFEIYEPASEAMIADQVGPSLRLAAYNLYSAALALAGVLSGLAAAAVAGVDLRLLFVADAVSCSVCAAVVSVALPNGPTTSGPQVCPPSLAVAWRDRSLLALTASAAVFATVYFQMLTALPLTLLRRGLEVGAMGLLLTFSALTIIAAQPIANLAVGKLSDPFRALMIGYLLLGAGVAVYAVAQSFIGFLFGTVVCSLGDTLLLGLGFTLVSEIAPPQDRATYLATYGLSWGLAMALGPLLGTQLLVHAGIALTWLVAALLCFGLATVQPVIRRTLGPRGGAN